jgi:16S rRNA U516 pseudouridylate synthase RsuA-like enzyme
LRRVSFGGLELGDLPAGRWRSISESEVKRLWPAAPLARS